MEQDRRFIGPFAVAAASIVMVCFWPELVGKRAFFYFDLAGVHLPQRAFVAATIKQGIFPFWCPLKACGFPLFAEGQTGILYPFNLLALVLPVWWANNIITVVHILIAFFGAYVYMRRLKFSDPAACIAALGFSMGAFIVSHNIITPLFEAFCWLPFVMIAAETIPTKPSKGILLSAIFLGLALGAGNTQGFVIIALAFFARLMLLAVGMKLRDALRLLWYGIVAFLSVILIFAPYVVSQTEFVLRSYRAKLRGGTFFLSHSLGPRHLFELLVGGLMGDLYDASFVCGSEDIWEKQLYLGIVPLLFALAAVRRLLTDRRVAVWFAMFLGFLILSLGSFSPVSVALGKLPILGWMRVPPRLWVVCAFALAFLAGYGFDLLASGDRGAFRVVVAGAVCAVVLVAVFVVAGRDEFLTGASGEKLAWRLPLSAALACFAVAASFLLSRRRATGVLSIIVMLVVLGDLILGAVRLMPVVPPRYFNPPHFLGRIVTSGRIYSVTDKYGFMLAGWGKNTAVFKPFTYRLSGDVPLFFGLRTAGGNVPLITNEYLNYFSKLTPNRLRLASVSTLIHGRSQRLPPNWSQLMFAKLPAGKAHYYVRKDPVQLCWLSSHPLFVDSWDEALELIDSPDFDPNTDVVLHREAADELEPGGSEASGDCRIVRDWANGYEIEVRSDKSAILVLSESWYPGWRVWVDGEKRKPLRANYLFMAVPVEGGEHRVVFRYRPRFLTMSLSAIPFGLFLLGLFARKKRGAALEQRGGSRVMWFVWGLIVLLLFSVAFGVADWIANFAACLG